MKAMILAAGKGARMRPLTDKLPKPLLKIADKPILQYHIESLVAAGVSELIINHASMGALIEDYFGSGEIYKANIVYSPEGEEPLETGGGIKRALPLLGDAPFIVVNGDIWTDYDFSLLPEEPPGLAHLVLVNNPPHHPLGDFQLEETLVGDSDGDRATFSGIGVYRPALFESECREAFPLTPILRDAMKKGLVTGELYKGAWYDIGTPERLEAANNKVLC